MYLFSSKTLSVSRPFTVFPFRQQSDTAPLRPSPPGRGVGVRAKRRSLPDSGIFSSVQSLNRYNDIVLIADIKITHIKTMPDVLIRNIDKETLNKLKEMAKARNRSLQEELKELVELHARPDIEETRNRVSEILESYKASKKSFSDSADDLSKDRLR